VIRVVQARDVKVRDTGDRLWTLQADRVWRTPNVGDDFVHDIASGRGPALVLLCLVTVLAVVLAVWTPTAVYVPVWLILLILLVLLFFPARWVLRRPWRIVAAYGDTGEGIPVEQWEGTVRGLFKVRPQMDRIARNIESGLGPGADGLMAPSAPALPSGAPAGVDDPHDD
jgi:hypothetical protein